MNKKFSIIMSVLFLTCFLCVLIQPVSPKTNFETIYTIEKTEINESNAKTYLTSTHSIRPDVDEKFSLYNRGSKYVSLTSDSYNVIVEKILNGYEYTLVINSPVSLKDNFVSFEVDTKGYTITQDSSLLTELQKKDYKVWNETYAFDGQNETRKDISLVGCLRFIPDGKITEEFIIKRPYIYDANLVGVFGTQKLEGNTLTVSIPQEFLSNARFPIFIDPTYIFSDGFESGDFTAWTGTDGSPAISGSHVHHGDYSMLNNGSAMCYYNFASSTHDARYLRTYVYFEGTPTERVCILGFRNEYVQEIPYVEIYPNSGLKYRLSYKNTSNEIVTSEAAATFAEDTWYCYELFVDKTNNDVEFFVNGVSTLSANDLMDEVTTGFYCGTRHFLGSTFNVNFDCVVVSDSYIGTEESMPTPTPTPTLQPTSTPLPTNEEGFGVFELLLLTAILVVINIVGLGFRVPLLNLVALIFSFTFIIIFDVTNMSILLISINCLVSVACLLKNLYGKNK